MEQKDCQYGTLLEAVNDLFKQGYTDELMFTDDGILRHTVPLEPSLFTIDSFHRFEGPSDPADMSIVYAISSDDLGLKGLLIDGYGSQSREVIQKMVKCLPAHQAQEIVQPHRPAAPGTIAQY